MAQGIVRKTGTGVVIEVGLHNLTDSKDLGGEEVSFDQLREETERRFANYDKEALPGNEFPDGPPDASRVHEDNQPENEHQTDGTHDPKPDSSERVFSASLEALLLTLGGAENQQATGDDHAPAHPTVVAVDEVAPEVDCPSDFGAQSPAPESQDVSEPRTASAIAKPEPALKSSLESMPLPVADPPPTPLPELCPEPGPEETNEVPGLASPSEAETYSGVPLESVMEDLRETLPDVELEPRPGKHPPTSDGIPNSVNEALPKFEAKPRMRICSRCGRETRLRIETCRQCGHADPSLGILDAVIAGDLQKVERILLARPHLIGTRTNKHEWSLLHMAASGGNSRMVELLVSRGASVNASTKDGKLPLHYAAGKGHLEIVQCLITSHADTQATYNGKTALDVAIERGKYEVAEFLQRIRSP